MNEFTAFIKKFWIDIVIVSFLLVITGVAFLVAYAPKNSDELIANINLKDEKIHSINLTELGEEPIMYTINLNDGHVHVEAKHNAIRVKESTCPHQYCVHTGWITSKGRSIICVPYELVITIEGASSFDVEV